VGYRRTDDRRRLVFRGSLAGVAGMLLTVVAIAGCTGTTTSPTATLPTAGLAVVPTPLPPATLQDTAEPNPFATDIGAPTDTPAPSPLPTVSGRVLSWLTLQMPADLAAGIDSNFQNSLFGWSRGYLAIHGDLTSGSAVSWASSDGRAWQEGQALDMAGLTGGAQVEQVVEGPAGLLALGRVPGCADDGTGCMPTPATAIWTSTDGLHWSRVDLKNAFGGGAVGDVAAGPKGYLAVSVSSATTASPAVWLSSDGRAWRAVSLSTSPSPSAAAPSRPAGPSPTSHAHPSNDHSRVAILGAGTVGAEVARGFLRNPDRQIGPAGGRMLELVAIADMNVQGAVDRGMPREIVVPDAAATVRRDDVDMVVELLGGDEPARTLIAAALTAGKPVVTANKHVLAHHGAGAGGDRPGEAAPRSATRRRSAAARPFSTRSPAVWRPTASGACAASSTAAPTSS
jgi:hypothetical protein